MESIKYFDWKLDRENPVSCLSVRGYVSRGRLLPDLHSAVHLGIVCSGIVTGIYGGEKLDIFPGELYLTAPWELHCSTDNGSEREILLLNLDSESLQEYFFNCAERVNRLWLMPPSERMKFINQRLRQTKIVEEIISDCRMEETPVKRLLIWNRVLRFFIFILPDENDVPECMESTHLQRIRKVLKHLGPYPMSVARAAHLCGMSTSRFSTVFKSLFGMTFARYERTYRLNGASFALRRGVSLKEAAEEWGFCDKSHLSRLLKQQEKI